MGNSDIYVEPKIAISPGSARSLNFFIAFTFARTYSFILLPPLIDNIFAFRIYKVQPKIYANHDQIDEVKSHNVSQLMIHNLTDNSGDISNYDSNDKDDTFTLC
jgi:hypothetical protein